jgi:rare lipoprotein A (peptidoglycan hydrolase)
VQANGENYLIPVDADIKTENLLRDRAVSIQFTLAELNDAENALNIVVLDACRDNPFPWGRGASRGLQVVGSQPADSIVVYATSAGTTAADGTGRNGLFTTHLLNNLKTSGLEIAEVFRRTGADVSRASDRKQIPAVYNQFFGIAYLGGTVLQPAPISQPVPAVMAPQTPRNVRAGTPGTDRVTLNWDSVGAGVSYKVYYNTQNDPTRATALSNLTTGISMTITGLGSGTNYYFWVSTVKDGQESGKSPMVTVLIAATVPVNPAPNVPNGIYREEGIASWYGQEFNERATASGEIFDASQHTAAHPTLPFGTLLTVTNKDNGKRVMVRVNDRFRLPNNQGRIIDISRAAAEQLDLISSGTAPVIIESVGVLQSGGAR